MLAAVLLVPLFMDFRYVPVLSKREPPPMAELNDPELWTSNKAPGRLVMTAPPLKKIFPAPLQEIVPPFSSVRDVRINCELPAICNVAPVSRIIWPLPLRVGPRQRDAP